MVSLEKSNRTKLTNTSSENVKKHHKVYNPLIWILDSDPVVAPHLLTNKYLNSSINKGIQVLICARFWFAGIRSKRAFAYWFAEERAEDTLNKLFNGFSFQPGTSLKFTFFTHRTTKWARKCKEHMKFLEDFVWNGVCEWVERTGYSHSMYNLAEFLCKTKPVSAEMPEAHLKKLIPEWKNIPPKFRQNDVYKAFRIFYSHCIGDPWTAYAKDKVDIPEFLTKNDLA